MWWTGSLKRKRTPEWTFRAVNLPYRLMFGVGIVDRFYHPLALHPLLLSAGTTLTLGGIVLRVVSHFHLGYHFSPFVEMASQHQLTERGFYRYLRHPMYLGTLMILLGMPLLLASWWSVGFAVLSGLGLVARVRKEEQFLIANLPGYQQYMQRTWRLVPWVW